jgi:hypothetical protein
MERFFGRFLDSFSWLFHGDLFFRNQTESKMFNLFEDTNNEFHKLQKQHQSMCLEELHSNPKGIRAMVRYLVTDYQNKGININYKVLLKELQDFYDKASGLDKADQ